MFNLNYEDNSFDLIWVEGAIFVIGFEKGLRDWKPIEAKLPFIKARYKDNKEALQFIGMEETEIEMFRRYSDYYGYVFYIMQIS